MIGTREAQLPNSKMGDKMGDKPKVQASSSFTQAASWRGRTAAKLARRHS